MKTCSVCGSDYDNVDASVQVCSGPCGTSSEMLTDLVGTIERTRPTSDPRIFFYPLGFGKLVDEYTILSLKRSHAKSVKTQQEIDYQIWKCKKSIQTHVGQMHWPDSYREALNTLVVKLYRTNAAIWRNNDLARNRKFSDDVRRERYFANLKLGDERTSCIRQLDTILTGKTGFVRVYCGEEV